MAAPGTPPKPATTPAQQQVDDSVIDAILPCGLRVLISRDLSLPVASVILALETGSEDDPNDLPGLSHALAYHLIQGNRELSPGEALATAHDGGGLATLATGQSQVRFESVVPLSRLDSMLWAESQRLRSPTLSASSWQKSLSWAGGDRPQGMPMPREAVAAAHGIPSLARDGRKVTNALRTASLDPIARAMRGQFNYARATLVVVGPKQPEVVLSQVTGLFADLPEQARSLPARPQKRPSAEVTVASLQRPQPVAEATTSKQDVDTSISPQLLAVPVIELGRGRGMALVWPVDPTPEAAWVADVICKTINQQRRSRGESRKVRVRCGHHRDARRGTLLIHATGTETPVQTLADRLARMTAQTEAKVRSRYAQRIAEEAAIAGQTPLGRARLLAALGPATHMAARQQHAYAQVIGLATLQDPARLAQAIARQLDPARAIALVKNYPSELAPAPTETGDSPGEAPTPDTSDTPPPAASSPQP